MNKLTVLSLAAAAVLAAAGCSSDPEPVQHRAVQHRVANVESGVDITCGVIQKKFVSIEKRQKQGSGVWVVESTPQVEVLDMGRKQRRFCRAIITPVSATEVNVEVAVIEQQDQSDTGYGENSASNPKWGPEVHDQQREFEVLSEIEYQLQTAAKGLED